MPRRILGTVNATRRARNADRYYQKNTFNWVDAFPEIHGTAPEKMVYQALTTLGIPFYFLNDIEFALPEIEFFKKYQADFIIPSIKMIIEVQGAYWHSKPAAIESDAFKMAVYESFGYKAVAWWDYDITTRLDQLISSEPSLLAIASNPPRVQYGKSTELTPMARTKIDTSKGIRTMNARKQIAMSGKVGKRKLRKGLNSYARSN